MGVLSTLGRGAGAVARGTVRAAKNEKVRGFANRAVKGTLSKAWEYSGAANIEALEGGRKMAVDGIGAAANHLAGRHQLVLEDGRRSRRSRGGVADAFVKEPNTQLVIPSPTPVSSNVETSKVVKVVSEEGSKNRRIVSAETRAKISAANIANAEQRAATRAANRADKRQAEVSSSIKTDTAEISQHITKSEHALATIADNTRTLADSQRKADSVFAKKGGLAVGGAGGAAGGGGGGIVGGLLGMAGSWAAGKVISKIPGVGAIGRLATKIPGVGGLISKIPGMGGFAEGAAGAAAKTAGEAGLKAAESAGGKAVAETAGKAGLKAGAGAVGKSILKKIPLIGALAGIGFGAKRAFAGDWTGAGLEVASGLASTLPGIGTGASIGIDAALAGRDIYNANQEAGETPVEGATPALTPTVAAKPPVAVMSPEKQSAEAATVVNRSSSNVFASGGGDANVSLLTALTDAMLNEDKGIFVKPAKDPFGSNDLFGALTGDPQAAQTLSPATGGTAALASPAPTREGAVTVRPLGGQGFVPNSERPGREREYMGGGWAPQPRVTATGSPEMAVTGATPQSAKPIQVKSPASAGVAPSTTKGAGKGFKGFGSDVDGYIAESSAKYGIPEDVLRGFVKMEAGWTGQMSPTGAIGTGQFIQGTWDGLAATKDGKEIGMEKIGKRFRTADDPRFDKRTNTLATGLLAKQNAKQLQDAGLEVTGENLYMMHNIGPGVIPALQGKGVSDKTLLAMKQNGMKAGQTPQDFVAMQKNNFNKHYAQANAPEVLAASKASKDIKVAEAPQVAPTPAPAPIATPGSVTPPAASPAKVQANTLAAETAAKEQRQQAAAAPVVVPVAAPSPAPTRQASSNAGSSKAPLLVRNNESSIARVADNMISKTMS